MNNRKIQWTVLFGFLISFFAAESAFATLEQAKTYQKVFGGDKPKCLACHMDKLPKKEEGRHEWNDYGKKLRAVKEIPDEEVYKQVGKNEQAE